MVDEGWRDVKFMLEDCFQGLNVEDLVVDYQDSPLLVSTLVAENVNFD